MVVRAKGLGGDRSMNLILGFLGERKLGGDVGGKEEEQQRLGYVLGDARSWLRVVTPSPLEMNSLEQAEDLKAFERRLTEYIACLQPATGRWRIILIVVSVCTATGAWNWLIDPETQKVSFFTSLWNHPFFTISCITLIGLFFAGIHKRVVAPSIIAARCRTVLAEYNMSCDDVELE
ncbi:nuclear envelope phosphatase-regulatory subunit 1 isoform X2 [Hemicordylus capensis]|uniref:nuclear envelope phosphatase-regulatory subunit 1 isoform X2 n=1 Tax=Hemicordylus capensis TaxID=884348 RepID=UPI0023041D61|nr:nuclear envelope phosphatase-regulatory subunit 1 isoform X2 [Hemicordylus capensis]